MFFSSSVYRRNSGLPELPVVYVEAASACAVGFVASSFRVGSAAGNIRARGRSSGSWFPTRTGLAEWRSRRGSPCTLPWAPTVGLLWPSRWCCRCPAVEEGDELVQRLPALQLLAGPVSGPEVHRTGSWTSRKRSRALGPKPFRTESQVNGRDERCPLYPPGVSQEANSGEAGGGRPGSCLSLSDGLLSVPPPSTAPNAALASQLSLLGS